MRLGKKAAGGRGTRGEVLGEESSVRVGGIFASPLPKGATVI